VETRWHGKVCHHAPSPCEDDDDCEACNECAEGPLFAKEKVKRSDALFFLADEKLLISSLVTARRD